MHSKLEQGVLMLVLLQYFLRNHPGKTSQLIVPYASNYYTYKSNVEFPDNSEFFFRRTAINKQRSAVFGTAVSNRSAFSETIQQR